VASDKTHTGDLLRIQGRLGKAGRERVPDQASCRVIQVQFVAASSASVIAGHAGYERFAAFLTLFVAAWLVEGCLRDLKSPWAAWLVLAAGGLSDPGSLFSGALHSQHHAPNPPLSDPPANGREYRRRRPARCGIRLDPMRIT